jgi:hypothetical protein
MSQSRTDKKQTIKGQKAVQHGVSRAWPRGACCSGVLGCKLVTGGALWAGWMGGEDGEVETGDRVWGVTIEFVMCWMVSVGVF